MLVQFVVLAIIYCVALGYDIKLTENEIDGKTHILISHPIVSDSQSEKEKLENIYYKAKLKPEIIIPLNDQNYGIISGKFASSVIVPNENDEPTIQPWSILWYIGSFGGLIIFFLIVSCSEWCCRNRVRRRRAENARCPSPTPSETPPPAYDLFAPPSYDSLCNSEKSEFQVYVVPVDTLETVSENAILQTNSYPNPPPTPLDERRSDDPRNGEVVLSVARMETESISRDANKEQREIATQT